MSTNSTDPSPPNSTEPSPPSKDNTKPELSSRLKTHIAIAAGLIVAALAAIPLLDNLSGSSALPDTPSSPGGQKEENLSKATGATGTITQTNTPPATETSSPVAMASAPTSTTRPLTPADTPPYHPDTEKTPGVQATQPLTLPLGPLPTKPTPSSNKPTPTLPPSHSPAPSATAKRSTPPSQETSAKIKPAITPATPTVTLPSSPPTPSKATPQTNLPTPAPPLPAQTKARPAGSSIGYNVQIGVYTNLTNAQKLIDDLKGQQIDNVSSETRVRVGPFRSRAEAEETMRRLKALGYSTLLTPVGG